MEAPLLRRAVSVAPPPSRCDRLCSVRAAIVCTLALGVATQTALRSVPNLVFNGDTGMAAELGYSNSDRGAILSAFGWAYTAGQIPGGVMSQLIGPKRTLLFSVLLGAVAGMLMPASARFSFVGPLVLNSVIGLSQGPVFPVVKGVMAMWLRPEEMARGNAFVVSAAWNGGQVLQYLISPRLLKSNGWRWRLPVFGVFVEIPGGWRLAWYFYAPLGLLWCAIWQYVGANTPRAHPRIRDETLAFLEAGTPAAAETRQGGAGGAGEKPSSFSLPLMARLLCLRPVLLTTLCLMLDGAAQAYANWLPQYYSTQLNFNLNDTGVVVALPLIIGMAASLAGGVAADAVMTRGYSVTGVRRYFNFVPTVGMVACLAAVIYTPIPRPNNNPPSSPPPLPDNQPVSLFLHLSCSFALSLTFCLLCATTPARVSSTLPWHQLATRSGKSRQDQIIAVTLQMTIFTLNGFKQVRVSRPILYQMCARVCVIKMALLAAPPPRMLPRPRPFLLVAVQAGISPIAMDISKKYAAAIVGIMNCGSNVTYYALANNVIGWWLDRGRCPSDVGPDPPAEDVELCAR